MFELVRAADAPMDEGRADPAFAAVDAHPMCGAFGRRFYPAVFRERRRDESFAVVDGNRAALLVADGSTTAIYASGVYDRERFDKPMAHWPMWLAILRSAERRMATFDIGDLPLAAAASANEVVIGYFKRGFATTIVRAIVWTWTPARTDRESGS